MTIPEKNPTQVEQNFEAFKKRLPELLKTHAGKFAVMHDAEIVKFFDTLSDAVRYGAATYGEGKFSVQEVTSRNINLGFHSHAVPYVSN